ncbi:CcmD family protein [Mongoliitalea daihaiensis]|nr:CcmD family protein [Mongoliitalea daihaiensis]
MALSMQVYAQEKIEINEADYQNTRVEMADVMRSEGKIYVLVGIIVIVFVGIVGYVVNTDRKVARMEELLKN